MSPKTKKSAGRRRTFAFGPGMSLALIAGVAVMGFRPQTLAHPMAVHETIPRADAKLWKPEPQSLLSERLRLSAEQQKRIRAIAADWSSLKKSLLADMAAYRPHPGSADQITVGLSAYSRLSELYDSARAKYWSNALNVLSSHQAELAMRGYK